MRVDELLAQARGLGIDRLDAQLLLASGLHRPRSWLLAHGDEEVPAAVAQAYTALLQRRDGGEPLAYLTGEKEFHGLMFSVSSAVLVPRPETELLVDWALELLAGLESPRVADLGTGSGAIAVTLAHRCPEANVTATDIDEAALAVAAANAARHQVRLQLRRGRWWQPLEGDRTGRLDLAVSNPPYIALDDAHLPALRHEPQLALLAGVDGLDALRSIVAGARARLSAGAWLLLEHGNSQGPAVRGLLSDAGCATVLTRRDLAGHERCTGGRWHDMPAG